MMLVRRLLPFLAAFVAAFVAPAALRAQFEAPSAVKASLVAAESSIQPGRPLRVALRLEHQPHWHTYWINPGTGYPTTLAWKLPPGWTASALEWPTPIVLLDDKGNITGNGYEGDTLLPLTLTPPADLVPGSTVNLAASGEWLMCDPKGCVPGDGEVALALPVRAELPAPDATWAPRFAAIPLPRAAEGLTFTATRTKEQVVLTVAGAPAALTTLVAPHVFAADALVQYDLPQTTRTAAGKLEFTLPVSVAYEGAGDRLTGVLAYGPAGARQSLALDVPFTAASGSSTLNSQLSATGGLAAATAPPAATLAGTLLLAFVGGLILNLMPCVFPVLGIKILGFVNQAGADRRKVTLHGLVFTAGVLLSFWALAATLALLRAGGENLGWGFQLQSPGFVFALAVVMLVFALNMSGLFEFGLSATGVGGSLQQKTGYSGSFFTGVLATVVATPCSAPFLAPALGAALALPVAQSFLVFTAIGVGLSLPYLLLSCFPSAVKLLPRPGAWMETFKQAMSFLLYATVGLLIWVLAGQVEPNQLLAMLFALTLIAMAVWVYGRWATFGAKPGRLWFGRLGGAALLLAGLALGYPPQKAAASPTDILWEEWSTERVAALRAEGRPIYVDFTARWCFTCQTNKKVVFSSTEVKRTFAAKKIATLRADWTNDDPRITTELARWGRSAVPFNLVYLPGAPEPKILPELLTPGIVLEAVSGAAGS